MFYTVLLGFKVFHRSSWFCELLMIFGRFGPCYLAFFKRVLKQILGMLACFAEP